MMRERFESIRKTIECNYVKIIESPGGHHHRCLLD